MKGRIKMCEYRLGPIVSVAGSFVGILRGSSALSSATLVSSKYFLTSVVCKIKVKLNQ